MSQLQDYFELLADAIALWGNCINDLRIYFAGIHITFGFLVGAAFVIALINTLMGTNDSDNDKIDPLKGYSGDDW